MRNSVRFWITYQYCFFFVPFSVVSWNFTKNVSKSDAGANVVEKFRKVSGTVWVSFEAVTTEKTIKENWTNKKNFDDNYNYYSDTIDNYKLHCSCVAFWFTYPNWTICVVFVAEVELALLNLDITVTPVGIPGGVTYSS